MQLDPEDSDLDREDSLWDVVDSTRDSDLEARPFDALFHHLRPVTAWPDHLSYTVQGDRNDRICTRLQWRVWRCGSL